MNKELMNKEPDIRKAAGVIIMDRKLLLSRSKGKQVFVSPGGKLEYLQPTDPEQAPVLETPPQALARELSEEQGIVVREENLEQLGVFTDIAAGHENEQLIVQMDVFIVNAYEGEPTPQAEIEENLWWDSTMKDVPQGSIFEHHVIPELLRRNLID